MKPRPDGFLSDDKISHDSEQFDYIRELHEYLWLFVKTQAPHASGNLADFVDAALKAAQSPWIPVTRALPADGQFILAKGPGLGNYIGGPEVDICRWDGELWNEGGTERADHVTFTHWMPLPQ